MNYRWKRIFFPHWWIFYKDSPPPSGKKSTCWQKLSENTWKLANFPSKIMFLPNFSYFFPNILPKFPNFGILTTIFPKIWTFSRNFTKNFFGKKCRGPWQNRDFLVKYSPVKCMQWFFKNFIDISWYWTQATTSAWLNKRKSRRQNYSIWANENIESFQP